MGARDHTVEKICARIAGAAHGTVARWELLREGVTRREIAVRLRKGSLIVEFRGVYRVGHRAPSTEARYMAAVKACGPGAVLCGQAAAYLYGLLRGPAPVPEVAISGQRRVEGIAVRRRKHVDRSVFNGIPITTVPQTVVDLAATLSFTAFARACHEAGVKYRTGPGHVEKVLARWPSPPGAGKIREVFWGDARVTMSVLERRFLRLLRRHGLPLPATNKRAGSFYVDCRWPARRLTVELDSYQFHNSRHSWEQDRRREREARLRGDEFRRYTYGDVVEDPAVMLRELRVLLAPDVI